MTFESLDRVDWLLLEALQQDARTPFAQLARRTGLSAPTVAERVKRLEDRGLVQGYHASIDPARLGLGMQVFVQASVPARDYPRFLQLVAAAEEVLECHHVTGGEAFVLRAAVRDTAHLEELIRRLSAYGQTKTSLVLSTVVGRRVFKQPAHAHTAATRPRRARSRPSR